jgi:hypothetical protein
MFYLLFFGSYFFIAMITYGVMIRYFDFDRDDAGAALFWPVIYVILVVIGITTGIGRTGEFLVNNIGGWIEAGITAISRKSSADIKLGVQADAPMLALPDDLDEEFKKLEKEIELREETAYLLTLSREEIDQYFEKRRSKGWWGLTGVTGPMFTTTPCESYSNTQYASCATLQYPDLMRYIA